MLSVIIINSEIYERYQKYAYFFNWFEDNSEVAVCVWNKNASASAGIDVLAPQLFDIVKSAREWNAYIIDEPYVSYEHIEKDFKDLTQYSLNPYERSGGDGEYDVSEDVLMRLVYFLGGRGVEELEYITNYSFRAVRPINIYLLTPRIFEGLDMQRSFLRSEIEEKYESAVRANEAICGSELGVLRSSDFWNRYEYPPNCRFLVFDMPDTENVKYEDSWFLFWLATVTLVLNTYGSDELGPFKLYCLDIDISSEGFERFLNKFYTALVGAHSVADKEIENEISAIRAAKEDTTSNHPTACAPVYVTFPDTELSEFFPDRDAFGLTKDRPMLDYVVWENHRENVNTETHRLFKAISRGKSEAVDSMNRTFAMDLPLITDRTLTRYDIEDIKESLDKDELEMLSLECGLSPSRAFFESLERVSSRNVENAMKPRLRTKDYLLVLGAGLGVCFAGFLPFIISSATFNLTSFIISLIITAFSLAVVTFASLMGLKLRRYSFGKELDDYSHTLLSCLETIRANSAVQGKYLTLLLNYMEKYQMLKSGKVEKKHIEKLEKLTRIRSHYEDALEQCKSIAGLCDVELALVEPGRDEYGIVFETGKKIYLHEDTHGMYIPLNSVRGRLAVPFAFINALSIKEECLYESPEYDTAAKAVETGNGDEKKGEGE